MACKCIDETNEMLAERNTKLCATMVFGTEGRPGYTAVTLITEKIAPRGKRSVTMLPTFCPFCATRYAPEEKGA